MAAATAFWRSRTAVGIWLLTVAAVIFGMVVIGGLTRLTGSGLSITEWDPIIGAIPPLSDAAWQEAFDKYKQIPQFIQENSWMSLADFKSIFWWEWTHRLLGRLLGFLFAIPFMWFAAAGAIARKEWPRMVVLFALGGLQGLIGWWMVQSGLEIRVSVSQYRLAIHLGAAIILLGAILWTALDYLKTPSARLDVSRSRTRGGLIFVGLVYLQMLLGALVAGLHAGLIYNTWPTMDGRIFPEDPFYSSPWWINFFENPGLVQFDHRLGAYIVAIAAIMIWWSGRGSKSIAHSRNTVIAVTAFQIVLGIATLLAQAPLALAALHQITAAALFCAAIWQAWDLKYA